MEEGLLSQDDFFATVPEDIALSLAADEPVDPPKASQRENEDKDEKERTVPLLKHIQSSSFYSQRSAASLSASSGSAPAPSSAPSLSRLAALFAERNGGRASRLEIRNADNESSSKLRGKSLLSLKSAQRWKAKLQEYKSIVERFRKAPLPPENFFKSSLFHVWQIFPRQDQAFKFAASLFHPTQVFSFEADGSKDGQRKFLVTTNEEFWHVYRQMAPSDRHHYEIIREGRACKLYFDVEFSLHCNPGVDGVAILDSFIRVLQYFVFSHFSITVSRHNVLDLESSTAAKFSRHLIVHLPGAIFQDNRSVGNFVEHICESLDRFRRLDHTLPPRFPLSRSGVDELFLANDKGERVLFIDQGVYSRNRNFRLYLSSKLSKNAHLSLAKENLCFPADVPRPAAIPARPTPIDAIQSSLADPSANAFHKAVFMLSLVCNVHFDFDVRILHFDSVHGKDSARTQSPSSRAFVLSGPTPVQEGYSASVYPELDAFIVTAASRDGLPAFVRRWCFFEQSKTLLYDIGGNKFCENIGRQHKSNHVYFVVDLLKGVYFQRCHDPECRRAGFKGTDAALPLELAQLGGSFPQDHSQPSSLSPRSAAASLSQPSGIEGDADDEDDDDAFNAAATALESGDEAFALLLGGLESAFDASRGDEEADGDGMGWINDSVLGELDRGEDGEEGEDGEDDPSLPPKRDSHSFEPDSSARRKLDEEEEEELLLRALDDDEALEENQTLTAASISEPRTERHALADSGFLHPSARAASEESDDFEGELSPLPSIPMTLTDKAAHRAAGREEGSDDEFGDTGVDDAAFCQALETVEGAEDAGAGTRLAAKRNAAEVCDGDDVRLRSEVMRKRVACTDETKGVDEAEEELPDDAIFANLLL